jgi:hypothetical protein
MAATQDSSRAKKGKNFNQEEEMQLCRLATSRAPSRDGLSPHFSCSPWAEILTSKETLKRQVQGRSAKTALEML